MGKRDLTGVVVGLPAARGRQLTTTGLALSARARTIRDWSIVWLRDYACPALSTQRTRCDAFRVVRQRWAQSERLESYELRHARATPLIERGLAPYFVADQLRNTDGGTLVQRLYGHPSERGMRDPTCIRLMGSR